MTRLSLTGLAGLVAVALIVAQVLDALHEQLLADRSTKTQHLVEVAHGIVASFHAQAAAGAISDEAARAQALGALKGLRYGGTEYFWVHDRTKPIPRMIMHATVPALDGTVLDAPRFDKAVASRAGPDGREERLQGDNLFVAMNRVVERAGKGFVTYAWPKPRAGGGVTEELYPKVSYVKEFAPWGWVIGSGIYVDDVNALFWKEARASLIYALAGALVVVLVTILVRRSIVREVGGEPKTAMAFAQRIAGGDLTGEIELRKDDQESLLYVLAQLQRSLREMVGAMQRNAQDVGQAVEQLASESKEITLATQLQTSLVDTTRSGVDRLSEGIAVVNKLAAETDGSSQEAVRRSQEGAALAGAVSVEMQAIAETIARTSKQVAQLVARTGEIAATAKAIKDIATQTDLLALNAAIEAAHAGEQGRGFAIVADEVRKLAEHTTSATFRITEVVGGLRRETTSVITGMDEAASVIASGVEKASVAARALGELEQRANDSLSKMKALAEATDVQARTIAEIVQRMDEVTESTRRSERALSRSQAAWTGVERSAADLSARTHGFRTV